MQKVMNLPIGAETETEFHNIFSGADGLEVRSALFSLLEASDGTQFIYGCSAESANTGDVFHYLVVKDSSDDL